MSELAPAVNPVDVSGADNCSTTARSEAEPANPESTAEAIPPAAPHHTSRAFIALAILTFIAVVAALYFARGFFVPLMIGILFTYALSPLNDWLAQCRIPRVIGAALILTVLVGGMSWMVFSLRDEADAMIAKLPEAARKLRHSIATSSDRKPTTLQKVQEAAKEIQGAADEAGAKLGSRPSVIAKPAPSSAWLGDYALAQTALLLTVAAQAPVVLLLIYFLLASGPHFRRKLVQLVGPSFARMKDTVRILEEVEVQVQRYLFAMLVANLLVGLCTWLAFEALGMEQAGVWGVAAGVLHFIPYLGPLILAGASGVGAFLQFGSIIDALIVSGVSVLVAGLIGLGLMTWMQSRFARVNMAVLFIALLFFGWLWGVAGLLLGAPIVAIAKAICDHVEPLKPVGELLGA